MLPLLGIAACIDDPVLVAGSAGGGGQGGAPATAAVTTASSTASRASVASSSSTGQSLCGNGIIDSEEECDAGVVEDETCDACHVICECATCFQIPDSHTCYRYVPDALSQGVAAEGCTDCDGCGLAQVKDQAVRVGVSAGLVSLGLMDVPAIWVGATRVAPNDPNFVWRDGTPLLGDSLLWFQQAFECPTEPTDSAGEDGVQLWNCPSDGSQERWLADDGQSLAIPSLCERPPTGSTRN